MTVWQEGGEKSSDETDQPCSYPNPPPWKEKWLFTFFLWSGTSPDCLNLSKIIGIGFTMTLASSLSAHRYIPSGLMNLFAFSLFKCSLNCSSSTEGNLPCCRPSHWVFTLHIFPDVHAGSVITVLLVAAHPTYDFLCQVNICNNNCLFSAAGEVSFELLPPWFGWDHFKAC